MLFGAAACTAVCPHHGKYEGTALVIGKRSFPSRCGACEEEDQARERAALRVSAFDILTRLGEMRMGKYRKRENDREFFVRLIDSAGPGRVAVGKFWAASSGEAMDRAAKTYPGLFNKLETKSWHMEAVEVVEEIPGPESFSLESL